MGEQAQRFYEFDVFLLDAQERLLFRDGEPLDLTPKVFDLLLELVQGGGRVVGKKELMDKVWPDTFVEESNLTQHISTLRKKLANQSDRERYILTVPGRGYRFLPSVREWTDDATVTVHERVRARIVIDENAGDLVAAGGEPDNDVLTIAQQPTVTVRELGPTAMRSLPAAPTPLWKSIRVWGPILAVALVVVVAFSLFKFFGTKATAFSRIKLTRFTTTGRATRAAISPDGKYLTYVVDDAGQKSVWLRQVATGKDLQIVPPARIEFFYGLTFSHDGNYIYYVNQEMNRLGMLYQVPSLGGTSTKLLDDVDSPVTLSPDDKRLAFIRCFPGECSIFIANVDGTGERRLLSTSQTSSVRLGQTWPIPPAWSPDGKTIAGAVGVTTTEGEYQTLWGFETESGAGKPLTSQRWQTVGRMEWLEDGSGLVTTAAEQEPNPAQQIWLVPYPQGAARKITNDLSDYRDVSVTADSRTLIAIQTERKANIWIAPATDTNGGRQVTSTNYDGIGGLAWTPDGKVVYTSEDGSEQNLWLTDLNGSSPRQLTTHAGFNDQPHVSSDGRYIVFISSRSGRPHLWRTDIDGKHPLELTHGRADDQPGITPDSQWIVFNSNVAGKWALTRILIDGGEPVPLIEGIAGEPVVSPDGKLIAFYYRKAPAGINKIAIMPLAGGEPRLICDLPAHYGRFRWMPDGRAIVYADKENGAGNIWIQPLDGGVPSQLTHWKADPIFSFEWAPDGKSLAYASGSMTSDVVLINAVK
jgi:Tol biopolymer transport system component/DNA-binding winged helix-turn-helix (wHTH) protein